MKRGDTYRVPVDEPPDESGLPNEHRGHLVTVLHVRSQPRSDGPDPDDGGPNIISVECECGRQWVFADAEEVSS